MAGWASLVVGLDLLLQSRVGSLEVPPTVHALAGVALGLLLVFRTNASYERFWEGRKLWGGIVNETRNLARAASVFLAQEPALRAAAIRWTAAFAYSSMHALRDEKSLGPLAQQLPAGEVDETLAAQHVPLAVSRRITGLLAEARRRQHLSDYLLVTIDANVQQLIDYLGGCERIKKTPLPFAYVIHLRRALILYLFTLPFALVEQFGWATVAFTLIISYILFGIEEIGVEIENPFGTDANDLPLEDICATIEKNLLAVIENPPLEETHTEAAHA